MDVKISYLRKKQLGGKSLNILNDPEVEFREIWLKGIFIFTFTDALWH